MTITDMIQLAGGVALFLYGMTIMGAGLEKVAGGKMQSILQKLTSSTIRGILLGTFITGIIQSSAGTIVIVIGLVNSGIMALPQAVGVIMGANIGTTVTGQLIRLADISGDSLLLTIIQPKTFSPVVAFVGMILYVFYKAPKKRNMGQIMMGFGILFTGMFQMESAVAGLRESELFVNLFTKLQNPVLGLLAGLAVTVAIQSSSASVGILQALALTGSVTYGSAIPIIMGQNIGTCVTAMISSVGASKNAKRAAFVHLYFNVIGVVLFLTAFYSLNTLLHFKIIHDTVSVMGIAVIHSTFNVITTLVLLPFNRVLEKLAILTVPDGTSKDAAAPLLDKRLLGTPAVATSRAHQCTVDMAQLAQSGLLKAMSLVHIWNDQVSDEVVEQEAQVDHYEDALGTYLVQLSGLPLTVDDNRTVSLVNSRYCSVSIFSVDNYRNFDF